MQIRQAQLSDLSLVAPMFDAYRQFYGMPADAERARAFLAERLGRAESVIFVAQGAGGDPLGFVQLYPSFSSVSAAPVYILNDLFVVPAARRVGVARGLLDSAAAFARTRGALRLSLSTGLDNHAAQTLYASAGWVRDDRYFHYSLAL